MVDVNNDTTLHSHYDQTESVVLNSLTCNVIFHPDLWIQQIYGIANSWKKQMSGMRTRIIFRLISALSKERQTFLHLDLLS